MVHPNVSRITLNIECRDIATLDMSFEADDPFQPSRSAASTCEDLSQSDPSLAGSFFDMPVFALFDDPGAPVLETPDPGIVDCPTPANRNIRSKRQL
jgi:hypothetical protein